MLICIGHKSNSLSALGIDNTGAMGLPYGKEDIDKVVSGDPTSKNVYNAADSVFWRRIRLLMHDDLRDMYQRLENTGCWSTNGFLEEFDAWQSQWPEELWTKDMERKYIRPYFGTSYDNSTTEFSNGAAKKSSQYLSDMLNGRKKYQRRQWIRNQSVYMGTKYLAASVANDNIMLRCYEPSGAVVSPDYTLRIVPYIDMYLSVMFGSSRNLTQVRAKAGIQYELPCPISMSGATDIPFYIYAASNIQELSDLSACYFTTNNFAGATKLKKLKIGNDTPGYSNQLQILNLGTGEHDLLEILDVTNCTNLVGTTNGGTLNLSGCRRLSQLYAKGTNISSVVFAVNGALETAILPDSLTGLTMIGLDKITNFEANYDSLTSLTLEASAVDDKAIIEDAYDTIRNLRLINVNWTEDRALYNTDILNALSDMSKMYDTYMSGVVHINGSAAQREIAHYNEVWPYLTVIPATYTPEYKVTYVNADADRTVLGYEYVVAGNTITDPVGRTVTIMTAGGQEVSITMATPTMQDTEQYSYTFNGWDTLDGAITRDRIVVARYISNVRTYTVNWYQKINGIKLATGQYAYGEEAVYDYTPTLDVTYNDSKTYYYKPGASYIVWNGEWENRPKLYEHNDIPRDITGESQEIYRLFTGWDRSTGHVVPDFTHADGHIDVYAVWSECSELPAVGTPMRNMTPVQIYGVTRQPAATIKQYFSMDGPDYTAVTLGHDPEFSNVNSITPISTKTWFDGATGIVADNGSGESIKLLDANAPSFTMAIDFDMRDAGSLNADRTLVACYEEDGRKGFRLSCGYRASDGKYGPTIQWGTQTFDVGYSYDYPEGAYYRDVRYRDMVVIRHVKGDTNLYVYASNDGVYFNNNIIRYSKETASNMETSAPLVFGGLYHSYDNEFDSTRYGTGYIYWCKIWFDDLGEYACRRIASWPREVLHLQYYGTQRYYLADGGMTAASFISYRPLYGRSVYTVNDYSRDSLWSNSPARQFLANRLVEAFPYEWQSMMRNVKINSITSSNDGAITEETYDKIYLPAYVDVYPLATAPRSLEQFSSRSGEGTMITWFANSMARVKSKVLDISISAHLWTGSSDPRIQVDTNVQVGDLWSLSTNSSSAVYVFVDRATIERDHLQIRSNTILDDDGGWVQILSYWILRTPDSTNTQNGYQYQFSTVTATGIISRYSYNLYSEYGEGVSITPCFSI